MMVFKLYFMYHQHANNDLFLHKNVKINVRAHYIKIYTSKCTELCFKNNVKCLMCKLTNNLYFYRFIKHLKYYLNNIYRLLFCMFQNTM